MRKLIVAVLFSLGLAGCATHATYGNFVENPAGLNQQEIASDTVEKITELYPPAKTRFELKQPTPDAFGRALVRGLRDRGYALLEFDPETAKAQQRQQATRSTRTAPNVEATTAPANPTPTGLGLPLRYVFDQFTRTNMYRVTIMVGNESLTRPYSQESGGIVPAGYWVHKE
ncbi:conjugal transfer protein TrbH [Thiolapillus sp.]|uniref:conjugal transfer protein TrbH n=1 Tax=Thiolapillus sp. TaxID=2017437 RepID=UPI003AF618FF